MQGLGFSLQLWESSPCLLPRQQQPHLSSVDSMLLFAWVTAWPLESLKHAVPVTI